MYESDTIVSVVKSNGVSSRLVSSHDVLPKAATFTFSASLELHSTNVLPQKRMIGSCVLGRSVILLITGEPVAPLLLNSVWNPLLAVYRTSYRKCLSVEGWTRYIAIRSLLQAIGEH